MADYITFQPSDYFNTKHYVADQQDNRTITGVGFQPDFVWLRDRDQTVSHQLYDAVRGALKSLASNTTNAEATETDTLKAFASDGFTLGTGWGNQTTGDKYVSWNWKAGGSGSSNTDGVISATVSADASRGFSIIKYTGSGSSSTVGHGLGAAPDITIRKKINSTGDWFVHTTLIDGSFDFLKLNTTDAKSNSSLTGFTSTTVGVDNDTSQEIIYAFKSIKGFSKFGKYRGTGNATDGPFIYTGFKPAFFMLKRTNSTASWVIVDNQRSNPFNPQDRLLFPNTNATEDGSGETYFFDFLSNGVKIRTTSGSYGNGNGDTYIYMAFAEQPLVSSNDIPATAR